MKDVFLESSVLLLAAGGDHPMRLPSRRVVDAIAAGRVRGHLTTEAVQEFVFHRLRRGDSRAVEAARQVRDMCTVHPFDEQLLDRALDLMENAGVRGRDAVHAAAALRAGFDQILSADTDLDGVPGLTRVDPSDWQP